MPGPSPSSGSLPILADFSHVTCRDVGRTVRPRMCPEIHPPVAMTSLTLRKQSDTFERRPLVRTQSPHHKFGLFHRILQRLGQCVDGVAEKTILRVCPEIHPLVAMTSWRILWKTSSTNVLKSAEPTQGCGREQRYRSEVCATRMCQSQTQKVTVFVLAQPNGPFVVFWCREMNVRPEVLDCSCHLAAVIQVCTLGMTRTNVLRGRFNGNVRADRAKLELKKMKSNGKTGVEFLPLLQPTSTAHSGSGLLRVRLSSTTSGWISRLLVGPEPERRLGGPVVFSTIGFEQTSFPPGVKEKLGKKTHAKTCHCSLFFFFVEAKLRQAKDGFGQTSFWPKVERPNFVQGKLRQAKVGYSRVGQKTPKADTKFDFGALFFVPKKWHRRKIENDKFPGQHLNIVFFSHVIACGHQSK